MEKPNDGDQDNQNNMDYDIFNLNIDKYSSAVLKCALNEGCSGSLSYNNRVESKSLPLLLIENDDFLGAVLEFLLENPHIAESLIQSSEITKDERNIRIANIVTDGESSLTSRDILKSQENMLDFLRFLRYSKGRGIVIDQLITHIRLNEKFCDENIFELDGYKVRLIPFVKSSNGLMIEFLDGFRRG